MDYLPVFLKLAGEDSLVVGGGAVAARKVELLLRAGARVRVVAPGLSPSLDAQRASGALEHLARAFLETDLDGARVVIAATDDRAVNARVAAAARQRSVLVNVVDMPDLCTFIVPSIVDRSPIVAAVSSGGAAPVLARLARARIEAVLPAGLGALAELARRWRPRVKERLASLNARRRFWEDVLEGPVATLLSAGDRAQAERALQETLAQTAQARERAELHLLCLPSNDPDLLTLKAVQLLQRADLVAHDERVRPAVLDYARRDATRVSFSSRDSARGSLPGPPDSVPDSVSDSPGSMLESMLESMLAEVSAGRLRAVVITPSDGDALWARLSRPDVVLARIPAVGVAS